MKFFKLLYGFMMGTSFVGAMDNPYGLSDADLAAYRLQIQYGDYMEVFEFMQQQEQSRSGEHYQDYASAAVDEKICDPDLDADLALARQFQEAEEHALLEGRRFSLDSREFVSSGQDRPFDASLPDVGATLAERAVSAHTYILEHPGRGGVINWDVVESDERPETQMLIRNYMRTRSSVDQTTVRDQLAPIFAEYARYEFRTPETEGLLNNPQGIHMLDSFYTRYSAEVLNVLKRLRLGEPVLNIEDGKRVLRDILLGYGAVNENILNVNLSILFNGFTQYDTELACRMIGMADVLEQYGCIRVISHLLRIPENLEQQGGCTEGRRNRNLLAVLGMLDDFGLRK